MFKKNFLSILSLIIKLYIYIYIFLLDSFFQEKYTFNNEKGNSSEEEKEENENGSLKDELKQNIVRLIDNNLITEELVRAENWFPITCREWGEWKTKVDANAEKIRQRKEAETKDNDEAAN